MNVKATLKKIGDKNINNVDIKIPEEFGFIFEKHNLEMVEFNDPDCMTLHFIDKNIPNVDKLSYSIYNHKLPINIKNGFEIAFRKLVELDNSEKS